ncbi:MAG TPA: DUF4149 domain-containing protein [Tepidisphaeraceae bacterium]|jgi:putative Mn2+ efflux pump MntP|nr:DUF4149 domain-containing protein [Tepidisphaeraceae bacterium]
MRYLASLMLAVCWALWFGGIIMLLIGVMAVFKEFPPEQRTTASKATAAMFRAYGFYELAVASGALIAAVVLRLIQPAKLRTAIFVLLALAALLAAVTTGIVTPNMEKLRMAGEGTTDAFRSLHGQAMMLFSSRTLLLLVAGVLLPLAIQREPRDASNSASS